MRLLITPLFLLIMHFTTAQPGKVWFDPVIDENGNSINGASKILEDRDGFIWLYNKPSGGLVKFNGYNFKSYSGKKSSTDFFLSNSVRFIFKDNKQDVWIITTDGELMQYRPDIDQFILVSDTTNMIKKTWIHASVEDDDGNFWIGTNNGLYKYNVKSKVLKNYTTIDNDTTSINNNVVSSFSFDDNNQLWIGTTNGLCRYDKQRDLFHRVELINKNPADNYKFRVIRSLLFTKDKHLYIGTYGGMHDINLNTHTSTHHFHDPENKNSLSFNSIFSLVEDKMGNIWIATYGGGINRYSPNRNEFSAWKSRPYQKGCLQTNNVFTLYFDSSGKLWVGGADQGVFLYNPHAQKAYSVASDLYDSAGISSARVRTLFQENDSILWIGFNGAGVNQFNINSGKVINRFAHDPKNNLSLGHNSVIAIDQDKNGNLWFGLEGGGINMLNKSSGTFTRYTHQPLKNSIANNAVSAMLVDDGFIWITTYVDGLDLFDIKRKWFYHFSEDSLKSLNISFSTTNIDIVKHDSNIWFTTYRGIVLYDKIRNVFVKVPDTTGTIKKVAEGDDLKIIPYSQKELLVNSNYSEISKIEYISPSDFRQEVLWQDTLNRLNDLTLTNTTFFVDTTYGSFTLDNSGNIWLTHREFNLVNIDLKKKDVSTFTIRNQVNNQRWFDKGIYTTSDGKILLISWAGFVWFYPDQLKAQRDTTPVKVILTDLEVFNKPVPIAETSNPVTADQFFLSKPISSLQSITLYYNQNFVSFRFAALTYTNQDIIQYMYKLEGFDRNWINGGTKRFASYTNLTPGTYTFKVKATNPSGYWNKEATSIEVIVLPPFWKTWWFISFEIVSVLLLAYVFLRYKISHSIKMERLRNKIANDLHDEVGSNLTRISLYSDLLRNNARAPDKEKYLNSISDLSREVVNTMSDIVWSVDNRNDSFGDLIIRMKDFASTMLQAKNIEIEFMVENIDEKKILDPVLKQSLYLIFKESVNNIIKHAEATNVSIRISNGENGFSMVIHDDGKGIVPSGNDKGNGLRSMNKRAQGVDALLKISNEIGTTIQVSRKPV